MDWSVGTVPLKSNPAMGKNDIDKEKEKESDWSVGTVPLKSNPVMVKNVIDKNGQRTDQKEGRTGQERNFI